MDSVYTHTHSHRHGWFVLLLLLLDSQFCVPQVEKPPGEKKLLLQQLDGGAGTWCLTQLVWLISWFRPFFFFLLVTAGKTHVSLIITIAVFLFVKPASEQAGTIPGPWKLHTKMECSHHGCYSLPVCFSCHVETCLVGPVSWELRSSNSI